MVRAMDSLFGLPAHPLLVHIPVILLPMAAVGVVLMVIRPAWHQRYRWAVLVIGVVGALGAVLATSAGESLEERIVAKEGPGAAAGWEDHAGFGENARLFAILFAIVLAVFVLVPWFLERRADQGKPLTVPRLLSPVLAALALAASAGTVYTVVQAGHSGAKSVWCETNDPPNCEEAGG